MKIESWLSMPEDERNRRISILEFLAKQDRDSFFGLGARPAIEFLYAIGKLSADQAQRQLATEGNVNATDEGRAIVGLDIADLRADSCYLDSEQMEMLSDVRDPEVLSKLSRNLVVGSSTLQKLSKSSDVNVIIGVASNPNTPVEVLLDFINGSHSLLRTFALGNISIPSDYFSSFLQDKGLKKDRWLLLANWALPRLDYVVEFNKAAAKSDFDMLEQLALSPFLEEPEWFVDRFAELAESADLSATKRDRLVEALVNLASNPGLGNRAWEYFKQKCQWLLKDYPHLEPRPEMPW